MFQEGKQPQTPETTEHQHVAGRKTTPEISIAAIYIYIYIYKQKQTPWPLVRKRTMPTERQALVDEI
jgi:hypothetical protein